MPRPDGSSLPLRLCPLPLGFQSSLRERGLMPPSPPTKVARDAGGRPVRDEQGLAVLTRDERDSAYLNELERYHRRVAVLVVEAALAQDPSLTFESTISDDIAAHTDALYDELVTAGFAAGDLTLICDEVARMSNLVDTHLEVARSDFSRQESTRAAPLEHGRSTT
ncbi:hypothetical protein [Stratiformator vulcanicus]|uniref:hypothetical protein n=1 Tax=Stratiformator vulcanicus TaxID=2527980 RepID=UPI002877D504|nr:hypothetical protein [Stratiformator vulcanicus]